MADYPKFTITEAAQIAGMNAATVHDWLEKYSIGGKDDQRAETAGATTYLFYATVFELAIAAWLRDLGAHPKIACKAAKAMAAAVGQPNKKTEQETTRCAYVTPDGGVSFLSVKGTISTAEIQEGGWILPYGKVAQKVIGALWNKELQEKQRGKK